jgi:hypothetical protein
MNLFLRPHIPSRALRKLSIYVGKPATDPIDQDGIDPSLQALTNLKDVPLELPRLRRAVPRHS